jgi:hypothetical protein
LFGFYLVCYVCILIGTINFDHVFMNCRVLVTADVCDTV